MNVKTVVVGELQENCYIVENDTSCLIIDPGDEVNKIIDTSNEVLVLIRDNKDNCVLEDGQIKFKSKAVFDKYNELINKIKED